MPAHLKAMIRSSRRGLLGAVAALAATAAVRRSVAAQPPPPKLSQRAAHYQPAPKFGQSCAMCQLFRPPGSCQIVAGAISPHGWCQF
ncbi:MAG TPA: hypothetical protein VMF86_18265, partial [Stellaceae bacterium]|nr:hypothetical protein [Stellaceae bacterium]